MLLCFGAGGRSAGHLSAGPDLPRGGPQACALAYHFSRTEKAKKLEDAICRAIHKANGEAKEFINTAEEEALHVGTKVADKMAHEAHEAAEKADNLKNKVHNFADAKK